VHESNCQKEKRKVTHIALRNVINVVVLRNYACHSSAIIKQSKR